MEYLPRESTGSFFPFGEVGGGKEKLDRGGGKNVGTWRAAQY